MNLNEKRDVFWPLAVEKYGLKGLGYPEIVRVTRTVASLLEHERPPEIGKGEFVILKAIKALLYEQYERNVKEFHRTVVNLYGLEITPVKSESSHGLGS